MIHHHRASTRHGGEEDAWDVIESGDGQIDIWNAGIAVRQNVGTVDEAEQEADRLADAFDEQHMPKEPLTPEGDPIAARDVKPGYALDLYGDAYADKFRDPSRGLEYELAAVEEIEFETPGCVVISTDAVTFGCPPDHILYHKKI